MEGITIIFLKSKYPEQLSNHNYWNVKYIDVHGQMPLTIFRCQLIFVRQKDMVHISNGKQYNSPLTLSKGYTDPRVYHIHVTHH